MQKYLFPILSYAQQVDGLSGGRAGSTGVERKKWMKTWPPCVWFWIELKCNESHIFVFDKCYLYFVWEERAVGVHLWLHLSSWCIARAIHHWRQNYINANLLAKHFNINIKSNELALHLNGWLLYIKIMSSLISMDGWMEAKRISVDNCGGGWTGGSACRFDVELGFL